MLELRALCISCRPICLSTADAMVQLARNVKDYPVFAAAMERELGEFEFPDEFVSDVWSAVVKARGGS